MSDLTERDLVWQVSEALHDALDSYDDVNVRTFEDAGLLTRDKGLIVTVDGDEFLLTIVRGQRAR